MTKVENSILRDEASESPALPPIRTKLDTPLPAPANQDSGAGPLKEKLEPSEYVARVTPLHAGHLAVPAVALLLNFMLLMMSGLGIGEFANNHVAIIIFTVAVAIACASYFLMLFNGTLAMSRLDHLLRLLFRIRGD